MADNVRIQLKITAPTDYGSANTLTNGLQYVSSGTRAVHKFEADFTKTIDPAVFPEVVSLQVNPTTISNQTQYTGYSDGDLVIFSNPSTNSAIILSVDDGTFPPTQFCRIGPGECTFIIAKAGAPSKYYAQAETETTTLNIIRFESVQ
jgi:hypothetical protein|tara:strand:+ start:486 stop:929 length:444 start_codon:yes stop_codon:yes gene_type:complete